LKISLNVFEIQNAKKNSNTYLKNTLIEMSPIPVCGDTYCSRYLGIEYRNINHKYTILDWITLNNSPSLQPTILKVFGHSLRLFTPFLKIFYVWKSFYSLSTIRCRCTHYHGKITKWKRRSGTVVIVLYTLFLYDRSRENRRRVRGATLSRFDFDDNNKIV